jgi:hypothetical protein
MAKADALEERIDETRNELESYIFYIQNGIERDFPEFFDSSKIAEYKQKLTNVSTWFSDNEFDRLPIDDYTAKLQILKEFGEPALGRRRTLQQLPTKVQELKDRASKASSRLASKDERHSHITSEEREPLQKEISDYVSSVEAEAKAAESKPKHLPISFDFGGFERKATALETKVTTLLGKAKPPPPKPEPKPEEKKEGEGSADAASATSGAEAAAAGGGGGADGEGSSPAADGEPSGGGKAAAEGGAGGSGPRIEDVD